MQLFSNLCFLLAKAFERVREVDAMGVVRLLGKQQPDK